MTAEFVQLIERKKNIEIPGNKELNHYNLYKSNFFSRIYWYFQKQIDNFKCTEGLGQDPSVEDLAKQELCYSK